MKLKLRLLIMLSLMTTISFAQSITVVSPNGGEILEGCTSVNITWTETATSNFYDIDYSPNDGVTWVSVATAYNTITGSYTWVVPNISSTTFKIRVIDNNTPTTFDESDLVFTVVAPLLLTTPNGGDSTTAFANMPIVFSSNNTSDQYLIEYSTDAGTNWTTIVNNITITTGTYNWTVPNVDSYNTMVQITDVNNSCITDRSDSVFTIASRIEVTQPNGGEVWKSNIRQFPGGLEQDILINSDKVEYVYEGNTIYEHGGSSSYSASTTRDNEVSLMSAIPGKPVSLTFTQFSTRNNSGTANDDILYVYDGPTTNDPLIGSYVGTSSPGTITSTHPSGALTLRWDVNSGSSGFAGYRADVSIIGYLDHTFREITWDRIGTSNLFNIEYSIDNGVGWKPIISNYSDANGIYNWHVPNDPTSQALVRVIDADNGAIVDQSDAVFTIDQADPHLYFPNGGEKLLAALDYEITWEEGLFAGTAVVLEYSTDNGSTWNTINSGTPNDGFYTWTIPDNPTNQALLRVSEFGNTSFNDVSDSVFTMGDHIVLTNPLGGENLFGCDNLSIEWCAGGTSGEYKLEYSEDGGTTWNLIVDNHPLVGTELTYNWDIANVNSSQFVVRVSDAQTQSYNDQSGNMTVNTSQYLDLIAPNGGESAVFGTVFPITYTATGPTTNVRIEYSNDNGVTWSTLTNNTSGGVYNWTVPNEDTDNALILVTDVSNSCITDQSSSVFSLISELTVLVPNGGEVYQSTIRQFPSGLEEDILVNADKVEYVYLDQTLYEHGGSGSYAASTTRDNEVTLRPAILDQAVQLTFNQFSTRNNSGTSNDDILYIYDGPTINDPLIGSYTGTSSPGTVASTHPGGALTLRWDVNSGSSGFSGYRADVTTIDPYNAPYETVDWDVTGTSGEYDLEYSIDNGASWIPIVSNYVSVTGDYNWHVPNNPTTQALFKVLDSDNGAIVDSSDAVFTINKAAPRLFAPNGGEEVLAGLDYEITWEDGLFVVSTVQLEYSTDNGATWSMITTGTNNDGSYLWTVPNDPSTQALIRVSEFGNVAVNDVSDNVFTMLSYITLETPLGGESVNGCETLPITWKAGQTSGEYKLEYSEDGGSTWSLIVDNLPMAGTNPTYNWVLPNLSSSQFRIRVSDAQFSAKMDQSGDMIMSPSQYLDLTAPDGGESLVYGSIYPISYTTSGPVSTVRLYYSTDAGATWSTISNNTSGGNYNWTVPNEDSDDALVRVEATGNSCITDQSSSVFSLISELTVLVPNGGEVYQSTIRQFPSGLEEDILVNADKVEYVYLDQTLYEHGGSGSYAASTTRDNEVTLRPAILDQAVQLTFNQFSTRNNSGTSNDDILYIYDGPTINDPLIGSYTGTSSPGTVASTHPGGALTLRWDVNSGSSGFSGYRADVTTIDPYNAPYETVDWDVTGTSGEYDLEYSIDNGASWIPIVSNYVSVTGDYNWHVPNNPTTQALFKVLDSDNGAIVDSSDAVFTINKAAPRLFAPNGGEEVLAGLDYEITWEDGLFVVSTVQLEYSTDNGATWSMITTGTNNDGSYLWTVPNDPSTQALIRVSEFGNVAVNDVSDNVFTMLSYITLETPLGGESVNGCETLPITWKAGQTSGEYKLEYSEDGGSTWSLIVDNLPMAGTNPTYNWVLPNLSSSQFRIRVSDAQFSAKMDQSGDMIMSPSQYLDLTAPDGGESLVYGSIYPISYTTSGPVSTVRLYYSTDAGATWSTISNNTSGGNYNWTVPNEDSDDALVRVEATGNSCITDQSSSVFSLISELTVLVPNGGEVYQSTIRQFPSGLEEDILVNADKVEYVYLDQTLYEHGGSGSYAASTTRDNEVTLRPAILDQAVQLTFNQFSTRNNSGTSNDDILYIYDGPTINDPLIGSYTGTSSPGTVASTHPGGALTLRWDVNSGSSGFSGYRADVTTIDPYNAPYETVDWDVTGTSGEYDLEYSIDNGASWIPIVSNYVSVTGDYNWHVPNNPTTQALFKVLDSDNGAIVDSSDAVFTINKAAPRLFAPNGGEEVLAGLDYEITWEDGLFVVSTVQLEYSTDNGATWSMITTGTNNDGSYLWTVPNDPSTQALIRVSEFGNVAVNDVSDNVFTMLSYITLETPLGGESVNGCETLPITWKAGQTSGEYKLEYSEDGGSTWSLIVDNLPMAGTNPTYNWVLPNLSSSQFRIRVSDAQFSAKMDQSGDMIMSPSQYLDLTAPDGGESLVYGSIYPISYTTSGPVSTVRLYYSTDAGATWSTISNNTSGGNYNWTVPNEDSDDALVRVEATGNSCITDQSSSVFSLISELTVLVPNGGEVYQSTIRQFPSGLEEDILVNADKVEYVYLDQTLYEHGGSGSYAASTTRDNEVTLRPAILDQAVQLTFNQFSTRNNSGTSNDDILYIYDGPTINDPLIGSYTGTSSPGTVASTHLGGALTLRWDVNSGSSGFSGYRADVTTIDPYNAPYETVDWDVTGTSGEYDLEYSIDNGASWIPIVSNYVSVTGDYNWHVPNNPTTQALFKVLDSDNGAIVDSSDAVFTINKAAPRLFAPNGGEEVLAGLDYEITWEDGLFVVSTVQLEYSTDNGATWSMITTGTNNDGSYLWTVPNDPSTQALIRVSEFGNVAVNDVSDNVFTMLSYITLETPLGGESVNGCETLPITWKAGQTSGEYKLEYSEDGGSTWSLIVDNLPMAGTNPTYNWVLPNLSSSQFRIRVSDAQFSAKMDQSGDMTLSNTTYVQLVNPNGGDSLVSYTVHPIQYITSGPVTNVRLEYSIDFGATWNIIVSNTSGGTYNWTIPNVDSDSAWVRVQDVSNACNFDISDDYVKMISDVYVTQPNGGEFWKSSIRQFPNGLEEDILVNADKIEYVYNDQTLYEHGGSGSYAASTTRDNEVTLRPAVIDHAVQLTFNQFSTRNNSGTSNDDILYIYDGPTINDPLIGSYTGTSSPGTVASTHPDGSLTLRWDVNSGSSGFSGYRANIETINLYNHPYQDILWDVIGTSGAYDLEYSVDNGASWIPIVSNYTSASGEYKWHVPNNPTTEALVRVLDAVNNQVLDVSDAVFTIDQADPKLFTPNGGEEWFSQAPHNITWEPGLFVESAIRIEYTIDNGSTWNSIVNGTANDGLYSWTPPIFPESYPESRVRISEFTSGIYDISDTLFTLSPAIQIYSPNGSPLTDSLRGCTETTVIYRAGGTTQNYLMQYSADGGSTWNIIESSYFSDTVLTGYDWAIPNLYSDDFLIKVSDAGDLSKFDVTDYPYIIRQPITIITPNSPGNLSVGSTYPITWDSDGASNFFDLYYSTDAGATWTTIALNQNITSNQYDWVVPNDVSNQVLVRVVDNIDNCKEDISDNLMSIIVGNSPIVVTNPAGGENWVACGDSLITWDAVGTSGFFDIDYSIDGGAIWTPIVSNYATATNDYLWSLPAINESQVLVRVTDANDLTKTDMNDGFFSLMPLVPASINASGPLTFCSGGSVTLTSSSPTGNLWSPNSETTQDIVVSTSGFYSVQVSSGGCTATSAPIEVVVNPVPNAPIAGGDANVSLGDPINLTASTVANATYQWTGPSGFASTDQNPVIPTAGYNNSGTYSVTVEVNGCSSLPNTHDVTVGNTATVSGEILTETGSPVTGVNVTATGYSTQNAVTPASGYYELFLENNETYSVLPSKNNDVVTSNGVTTLDLILMQRHILNVDTLDSPYKILAGDVDFSNAITTLDIVLAQSLILQNTQSYPNSRLWGFVSSDATFADPVNPFPYVETRDYLNVTAATSQDFVAMKLGDVNNSWNPFIPKEEGGDALVRLENVEGELNGLISIPVYFEYNEDLAGFQMTFDWDPSTMEYVGINAGLMNPRTGKLDIENGTLPMSWYSEDPNGIPYDGELAFELQFRLKNEPIAATNLLVNSEVIPSQIYTADLKTVNTTSFGGRIVVNQEVLSMEVHPNPFGNQLGLSFELANDQEVRVTMTSATGGNVASRQAQFDAGEQKLELNDWLFNSITIEPGVYWITVEANNEKYVKKVVKL